MSKSRVEQIHLVFKLHSPKKEKEARVRLSPFDFDGICPEHYGTLSVLATRGADGGKVRETAGVAAREQGVHEEEDPGQYRPRSIYLSSGILEPSFKSHSPSRGTTLPRS